MRENIKLPFKKGSRTRNEIAMENLRWRDRDEELVRDRGGEIMIEISPSRYLNGEPVMESSCWRERDREIATERS